MKLGSNGQSPFAGLGDATSPSVQVMGEEIVQRMRDHHAMIVIGLPFAPIKIRSH